MSLGVFAWCLITLVVAARALSVHYPIGEWLVWRYLTFAGWSVVWLVSCLAAGHVVVRRLSRGHWPFLEELVQSLAVGTLLWGLVTFLFGITHALYPFLFALLPLAFLAVGLPGLIPRLARFARRWRRSTPLTARVSMTTLLTWGGLAVGVALLYAMILSPKSLAYDARWYHVAVAEQWAGMHAITRSADGSSLASRPHLANWIYTWAFLWPGSSLFAKLELALHVEFALFLATLASIPVALRALLPSRRFWPSAAAALLLFPGIFVYDSAISGGADHILGFFALPVFLAWRRAYRNLDSASSVALALLLAAALLVKYQAIYFMAGVGLSFVARAVPLALRRDGASLLKVARALIEMAAIGVVVTAPLWLTNAIWYGNPVFPFLVHLFPSHPWGPDAIDFPDYHDPHWVGAGSLGTRLVASLLATFVFGFQSNDWPAFHGEWPVYGFLFSLLFPLAFVLKPARRAVPLVLMSLLAVFIWHFTYRQVRYLQALTPWLAVVVACVVAAGWQQGLLARLGLACVLALQVCWGSDHPFLPSNAMQGGGSPFPFLLSLASSGYTHRRDVRNAVDTDLAQLSSLLPEGAKVLLHERHLILGLEKDSIVDSAGTQSALSYRRFSSPHEVYAALKGLGVTHVHWNAGSLGWDNWSSDFVFYDFVTHYLPSAQPADGGRFAALPAAPPSDEPRYRWFRVVSCDRDQIVSALDLDGVFAGANPPAAPPGVTAKLWLIDSSCPGRVSTEGLTLVTTRGPWQFWSFPRSNEGARP